MASSANKTNLFSIMLCHLEENIIVSTLFIRLTYRHEDHNIEFVWIPDHPHCSDVDHSAECSPAIRVGLHHFTEGIYRDGHFGHNLKMYNNIENSKLYKLNE